MANDVASDAPTVDAGFYPLLRGQIDQARREGWPTGRYLISQLDGAE